MNVVVDVPTNLGLRPPATGCVPGADKAPAALRAVGLHGSLLSRGWREGGVVLAGRYKPDHQPDEIRNQAGILEHAARLAEALAAQVADGHRPLVLGGDCSTLLGCTLALRRRGRYALVHVDGHTDFRHPGNSTAVANLAGEDFAAACGLHHPRISDIDTLAPYIHPENVVQIGCRSNDENLAECRSRLGGVITAPEWTDDPRAAAQDVRAVVTRDELDGYWVHVDVDVLDPEYLPAVDSPDSGGVSPDALVDLLTQIWPGCVGMTVGILDPDLDPDGRYARLVADVILRSIEQSTV